jgi:hypothetical protein
VSEGLSYSEFSETRGPRRKDCHTGSNEALMEELKREAESAAQKIDQHWKEVTDKQKLCQQLADQLNHLNSELLRLHVQLSQEQSTFNKALDTLQQEKHFKQHSEKSTRSILQARSTLYHSQLERCEDVRVRAVNAAHDSVEEAEKEVEKEEKHLQKIQKELREAQRAHREAESAWLEARNAHQLMTVEEQGTAGARTSEGQALQRTKKAVSAVQKERDGVEKTLKRAKKPPPPVYQPLPDSRKTDFNALAVLFFTQSHLTGSMPILQRMCCDAQLAVCPWPLKRAGLWDVEEPLSAANIHCRTWNEYIPPRNEPCSSQPHEGAIAAGEVSSNVKVFADFKEPSPTDAEVCSPPHAYSSPPC